MDLSVEAVSPELVLTHDSMGVEALERRVMLFFISERFGS